MLNLEKVTACVNEFNSLRNELAQTRLFSNLDALLELLSDINLGNIKIVNGKPNKQLLEKIAKFISEKNWQTLTIPEKRKMMQAVILAAQKADNIAVNDQITPDPIGYLLGHLITSTKKLNKNSQIIDFNVGCGNLLWTIQESLDIENNKANYLGIDMQRKYLDLLYNAELIIYEEQKTRLINADVIINPVLEKADVLVAELPLGIYNNEVPNEYQLKNKETYSNIEDLLLEKGLDYLKDDGLAMFVLPKKLLDANQKIFKYISRFANIQAIIGLSDNLFKNAEDRKVILIISKKGFKQSEVLLAQYPPLNDLAQMQTFLQDIQDWGKVLKEN